MKHPFAINKLYKNMQGSQTSFSVASNIMPDRSARNALLQLLDVVFIHFYRLFNQKSDQHFTLTLSFIVGETRNSAQNVHNGFQRNQEKRYSSSFVSERDRW